jgi:hypothetical protein
MNPLEQRTTSALYGMRTREDEDRMVDDGCIAGRPAILYTLLSTGGHARSLSTAI